MVTPAEEQLETITVDAWLTGARARLDRVQLQDLAQEIADGAIVIDTRDSADREAEGALPGAVIVTRNVLEWRMSPSSPTRLEGITADSRAIIACNDGFSSSIAAASLHDLGLPRATDLVGGYRAWRAATA
jgi:rhodanese-related sulfurtransferase